jgi:hypothetical protein
LGARRGFLFLNPQLCYIELPNSEKQANDKGDTHEKIVPLRDQQDTGREQEDENPTENTELDREGTLSRAADGVLDREVHVNPPAKQEKASTNDRGNPISKCYPIHKDSSSAERHRAPAAAASETLTLEKP